MGFWAKYDLLTKPEEAHFKEDRLVRETKRQRKPY